MVQPYDPVGKHRPSYWDRNPRSYYQEPLNNPDDGLLAPVVFTDDDTPVTVEFTCSHRQLGEFLDCIEQGALILYPDRRAQIYFDFVRNWDFPKEPVMQLRSGGCGIIEVSNDRGATFETLWDASCVGTTVGPETIRQAIDDLTYWREMYSTAGPSGVAPLLTAASQTDRDTAYCIAAATLVDAICEGEIEYRENLERDVWAVIGAMIVELIGTILIGAFALPAFVILAIAGAIAGAAAAQFHIYPLEDLRSPGKRKDTACCIAETVEGHATTDIASLFASMAPCVSYPLGIEEIYPMLNDLDIVVSFLRLAEIAMPDVLQGAATCPCGTLPVIGQVYYPGGVATPSGVIVTDPVGISGLFEPSGDLINWGHWKTTVQANAECTYDYYRRAEIEFTVSLGLAVQSLFVQCVGRYDFTGAAVGQQYLHRYPM